MSAYIMMQKYFISCIIGQNLIWKKNLELEKN